MRGNRLLRAAVAVATAALVAVGVAGPATAEPATAVTYPAWASATRYTGLAFDTCTAPALDLLACQLRGDGGDGQRFSLGFRASEGASSSSRVAQATSSSEGAYSSPSSLDLSCRSDSASLPSAYSALSWADHQT